MVDITTIGWLILGIAAILIGISKTGIPGLGILAVPLVTAVIPAKASTGLILPMLIIADIFAVSYYHRHAVWKYLISLMPWAAVGIVIGYFFMGKISDQQLKPFIGVVVLVMLVLNYWRNSKNTDDFHIPSQWWFGAIIGLIAGIVTMMANAAGPIMAIYLLAMRLPKNEFLGTGSWYFLILNCFKVPFSANLGLINPLTLKVNLILLPVIVIGAVVGIKALPLIPQKRFNFIIQILAATAALKLLF
jgi:uncharacterized membrane protein YfcA